MAQYDITSPDGQKFRITAPDDATEQDVMSYAQQNVGGQKPQAPPQPQAGAGDYLQQVAKGGTFGFADEIGAGLAAGKMAFDKGRLNDLGSDYDAGLQGVRAEQANFEQQNPLTSMGLQTLGGVGTALGGGMLGAGKALMGGLRAGGLPTRIASNAAAGAASGAAYGFGTSEGQENRLQSAGQGALAGGAVGGAIPLAGAAFRQIAPEVNQTIAPLAQKAMNDYKIPLSSSQLGDSGFAKTLASTAEEVPLSGALKFRDKQQTAFNKALAKTIGEDADKITPETINSAYINIGKKFDDALAGRTITINDDILNKIAQIESDASESITGDHFKIVKGNISKVLNDIAEDGTISGEKINSLRSNLTNTLRKTRNDASSYLADLRDAVVDASVDGSPGSRELLNQARLQYKNLKTIEPLAEKADRGDLSPSLLLSKVSNSFSDFSRGGGGELGDLARIGQTFLKDKIPNSGTPRRLMAYGALGAGSVANLPIALKALGTAAGYNALNTFQPLIKGAVNKAVNKPLQFPKNMNRVTVRPSDANLPVRK